MISFYIIEHNNGAYVIEVGNYIYPEDDALGYKVSGYMEEVLNSIKVSVS